MLETDHVAIFSDQVCDILRNDYGDGRSSPSRDITPVVRYILDPSFVPDLPESTGDRHEDELQEGEDWKRTKSRPDQNSTSACRVGVENLGQRAFPEKLRRKRSHYSLLSAIRGCIWRLLQYVPLAHGVLPNATILREARQRSTVQRSAHDSRPLRFGHQGHICIFSTRVRPRLRQDSHDKGPGDFHLRLRHKHHR